MINFVSPFPSAQLLHSPSIQWFLPLLHCAFYLDLGELGCFGRCNAFLLKPAQLWSLLVNSVQRFFIEILNQNCPNWHIHWKKKTERTCFYHCKSVRFSSKNPTEISIKSHVGAFPEAALVIRILWPAGVWPTCQGTNIPLFLPPPPFVVLTLSEVGSFSTYDCFLLVFSFQSHSVLWD